MDFIIGGCHQGKTKYAMETYGYSTDDIVNGEELEGTDMGGKKCLNHFHLLVRKLLEHNVPVEEYLEQLFAGNEIEVVLTDEIGYGIVPVEAFEREYREIVGRQCCSIARKAVRVQRVVAGIASTIKQEGEQG